MRLLWLIAPLCLAYAQICWAAPVADFEIIQITGSTCVAPCVVMVDAGSGESASPTTDAGFTRDFHSLLFEWDFGDPGKGNWPQGAHQHAGLGWDKNYDIGPIAGHLYDTAGTYTITLTVTNPDGETDTAEKSVTVVDPETHYTAATDIFCFADITGNGGDYTGCPSGATQTDTTDFDNALNTTCNIDGVGDRLCLFRAGDTFTLDAGVDILDTNTTPSMVSSFNASGVHQGTFTVNQDCGAPCTGFNGFATGDFGTYANFAYVADTNCATDPDDCGLVGDLTGIRNNMVFYNITATNLTDVCIGASSADNPHPRSIAVIEVSCTNSTTQGPGGRGGHFWNGSEWLGLGNLQDNNQTAEFNHRYRGGPTGTACGTTASCRYLINHSNYQDPNAATGRNSLQIRGSHRWGVIQDNVFSSDDSIQCVRLCNRDDCNTNTPQPNTDIILAYNFCYRSNLSGDPANFQEGFVQAQAGDVTIRNNIMDMQGIDDGVTHRFAHKQAVEAGSGDNMHVLNNTVYADDSLPGDNFTICDSASDGTGHLCRGNLAWFPNLTGTCNASAGTGFTTTDGNECRFTATNPFDSNGDGTADTPPAQAATNITDFRICDDGACTSETIADDGPDYSSATDHYVYKDAELGCRPVDSSDVGTVASHDIGADEVLATTCTPEIGANRGWTCTGCTISWLVP